MAVIIEKLNDRLIETWPEYAKQDWSLPKSRRFFDWFFINNPGCLVYVAHDQGRWLAALGGFERLYVFDGVPTLSFEPFAWSSLRSPESKGWGSKVMQAFFEHGRPLVQLGGSPATMYLMPKLGFEIMASGAVYNLPFNGSAFESGAGLKGQLLRRGLDVVGPMLRAAIKTKSQPQSTPLSHLDSTTLSMQSLPGFQAQYSEQFFKWLNDYPETGMFLPFRFMRDGEVVGWAFARVSEETPGVLVGRILESRFGRETTSEDHLVMMRHVTAAIAGHGASIARAFTSCPDTNRALKSLHYLTRTAWPAMIYTAGLKVEKPIRLSQLRADGAAQGISARAVRADPPRG